MGILDDFSALNNMGHLTPKPLLQINPMATTQGLGGILGGGMPRPRFTRNQLEKLPTEQLDRAAWGNAEGDVLTLPTDKINVKYPGDLENPQDKFDRGGMSWAQSVDFTKPVDISIGKDGSYNLEDGHHRWFAAQKLGIPLQAQITKVDGNSINEILRKQELP